MLSGLNYARTYVCIRANCLLAKNSFSTRVRHPPQETAQRSVIPTSLLTLLPPQVVIQTCPRKSFRVFQTFIGMYNYNLLNIEKVLAVLQPVNG